MKCKTCGDKGMLLKPILKSENAIKLEVVTCDCCGGWSTEGIVCENCRADAEGKPRPFVWFSADDFPQALDEYKKKTKRDDDEE